MYINYKKLFTYENTQEKNYEKAPNALCLPEHSRHINIPKVTEAH